MSVEVDVLVEASSIHYIIPSMHWATKVQFLHRENIKDGQGLHYCQFTPSKSPLFHSSKLWINCTSPLTLLLSFHLYPCWHSTNHNGTEAISLHVGCEMTICMGGQTLDRRKIHHLFTCKVLCAHLHACTCACMHTRMHTWSALSRATNHKYIRCSNQHTGVNEKHVNY